jgi:hypothetical protein
LPEADSRLIRAPIRLAMEPGERIRLGWRDRGWRWDDTVGDADDRNRLELQPFHAMHRADTDRVFRRLGREGGDRDAHSLQRDGGLLGQVPGAGGDSIACGSMPSPIHPRTRSASATSSVSRDPAAWTSGQRPCRGER